MRALLSCLVAYLLLLPTSLGDAFESIEWPTSLHVPEEVDAGQNFTGKIDVRVHNGGTTYAYAFRVFLAMRAGEETDPAFYDSDCYLLHEQSLFCDPTIEDGGDYISFRNTTFIVSIPSSVGPSGRHYVLNAQIMKTDGSDYGWSLESNVFGLNNGTGEWAWYQTRGLGYTLWGSSGIPCASYQCVRENCAIENSTEKTNVTSTYNECVNKCPDVYVDPSSTLGGQPTATLTRPTQTSCSATWSAPATITSEPTGAATERPPKITSRTSSAAAAAGTSSADAMAIGTKESFLVATLALLIIVNLT